jgi:hypothetical protein
LVGWAHNGNRPVPDSAALFAVDRFVFHLSRCMMSCFVLFPFIGQETRDAAKARAPFLSALPFCFFPLFLFFVLAAG